MQSYTKSGINEIVKH